MTLENDPDITVAGEAGDIKQALELITAVLPDLVLLDLNLGADSSLDHMEQIVAACPTSKILVLTGVVDEESNGRAAAGGAHGVVLKSQAGHSLLSAVKKVNAGEVWFDRGLTARLFNQAQKKNHDNNRADRLIESLTARERQIVVLIAEGLVNKDIGKRLDISEKTVRNHLTVIYSKLHVSSRLELAILASQLGIK
jgi:RNA polymerase sigma factor (sigma-70 family)